MTSTGADHSTFGPSGAGPVLVIVPDGAGDACGAEAELRNQSRKANPGVPLDTNPRMRLRAFSPRHGDAFLSQQLASLLASIPSLRG